MDRVFDIMWWRRRSNQKTKLCYLFLSLFPGVSAFQTLSRQSRYRGTFSRTIKCNEIDKIIFQIEPCYTDICLEPIKSFHAGPYNIRDPDARFLTTTTTIPMTTTTSTTSTTTTTTTEWKPITHMSTSTTMTTTTPNKTAIIIKVSIFYFFLPVIGFLVLLAILVWCCGKTLALWSPNPSPNHILSFD